MFSKHEYLKDSKTADIVGMIKDANNDPITKAYLLNLLYKDIHDREHPDIERFLFDKKYLGKDKSDIRPNVLKILKYINSTNDIKIIQLLLGSGAGKSYLVTHQLAYKTHDFLSYVNPQAIFNLDADTPVAIMNMSTNAPQAMNVIFKLYSTLIDRVKSFENIMKKHKIVLGNKEIDFDGDYEELKKEKYSSARAHIIFPEKHLMAISGHSKASSHYGYSVYCGTIDEADHIELEKKAKRKSGIEQQLTYTEELYAGLYKAIFTRFPKHGQLMMITTSLSKTAFLTQRVMSDKSKGAMIDIDTGQIMQLSEKKQSEIIECYRTENTVSIIGSTWIMKGEPRSLYISNENDVKALRDFGCVPPDTNFGAIPDPEIINMKANKKRKNPIYCDKHGLQQIDYAAMVPDMQTSYFMHFDISLTGDNGGVVMVHKDFKTGMYIQDFVLSIITSRETPFDFNYPKRLIMSLISRGFKIELVTFDGFQSANLIQDISAMGVRCELLSVDRTTTAYETYIALLYQNQIDYPECELLEKELRYLEYTGQKYDHPAKFPDGEKGSKDLADAAAGSILSCVQSLMNTLLTVDDLTRSSQNIYNINGEYELNGNYEPFAYLDANMVMQWNFKHNIPNLNNRSAYIERMNDELVLMVIGYQSGQKFYCDFFEQYDMSDSESTALVLANIRNLACKYVSVSNSVSWQIIDTMRKNNVNVMSHEMNISEKVRNKFVTPLHDVNFEKIMQMINAIKKHELYFCHDDNLYRDLLEVNSGNFKDKYYVRALSGWLYYQIQSQRSAISQSVPAAIFAGNQNQQQPNIMNNSFKTKTMPVPKMVRR